MTAPDDMPDADLDAAVAREVMGWEPGLTGRNVAIWVAPDYDDGFWLSKRGWRPSTDIAAAFDVVKRMREDSSDLGRFACAFLDRGSIAPDDGDTLGGVFWLLGHMTPRAICEAALAAVRDKQ